jgi:PAS domain S-box-containing protein
MLFKDIPIRQKLMAVILLTSGAVLLLTCTAFITYEIVTLHRNMIQSYATRAKIIAANSTASLAFQNEADATAVLGALETDPRVVVACLYDNQEKIFAKYPATAADGAFPAGPNESGYRGGHLDIFCPVIQGDRHLGTVYVQSDLSALTDRYRAYAWLAAAVIAASILVAYLLSRLLQRQISAPILALAETARTISSHRDFSVRAKKYGEDELGSFTDAFNQMLTEILAQDQTIKASEANYREIFEKANDGIIITDPETSENPIVDMNSRLEKMTGFSQAEYRKVPFDKLFSKEPGSTAADYERLAKKALTEGPQLFEWQALHKDGHTYWVEVSLQKTVLAGKTRLIAFMRDISDRKKLEETTRSQSFVASILENIPNMVFVKDAKDLRFVMFNKAGEELIGVPKADLIGKNDYDFFSKADADSFVAKDRKTLEVGKLQDIPEETLQTKNKGTRILHTKKFPVLNADGKPLYLMGISEDITEQKEQEKMKIYTLALETSNRELQDFVFVASHDLQEPLRKIQAFGEFLRDEFKETLGEMGQNYVERMRSAASRMQTLINDLLALTRVTTKAQPFVPIDLSNTLKGVLSDLETRIQEKKAKVEVAPLPRVEADETQMRQLFQNLIANALKFQRPGVPPEIKISASVFHKDGASLGPRCLITLEDNGIGFDNKYGEQIFKLFERLHGRDEYEGTGIGLAICRKVAERHGGSITAEGVPGKGSFFRVELPLHQKR